MNLDESLSLIAIQGPDAKNVLEKIIPNSNKLRFMNGDKFYFKETEIYITRSGYTGEDGFEISIKNEKVEKFVELLIENGSKLIGLGARDTLRLEAGLCLYGNDIDQKTSPIEANLKWAISKSRIEDNYPGSSIIKNQIEKGVKKLRVGIKPETRVIARGDTKIFNGESKEIGKITSGTFGPSVDCSIAMGYVDNIYSSLNTKIFLEIRGKKIPASICNLPFYKKNYAKGGTNV
jgi:aminomethyltransferase